MKLVVLAMLLLVGAATGAGGAGVEGKASLRGRITDFFGYPIPDTAVEVSSDKQPSTYTARSDQSGEYKLDNLPEGSLKVSVKARGFRQEELVISPGAGESALLDVALQVGQLADLPQMEVTGVVQQSGGGPLAGATVTLINAFNQRIVEKVRTDKSGQYRAVLSYPGQYLVYADKAGFAIQSTAFAFRGTPDSARQTANFSLSKLNLP